MSVSCEPEYLATQASCFQCVPPGNKLDLLIYLFASIAEVNADPQTLANLSKCYVCIPPGNKLDILIYLACQIVNEGGATKACIIGGVGPPAIAVPCNFSAYVEQPGPNYGLWLGDIVNGWSQVLVQGP